MHSATLRPRPAKDPTVFYDELTQTLTARREALTEARNHVANGQPMVWAELVEWLRFHCWYQQEEASFTNSWLVEAAGTDLFPALCRKAADDSSHLRLLTEHLASLGVSMEDWSPEPEWTNWISEFYAGGVDILERVIAHNMTGEQSNIEALERLLPNVPASTRAVVNQILPDPTQHTAIGHMAMSEYAGTPERQAHIHAWLMRSFELEQKARLAFDRRIRAIRKQSAANDALDDSMNIGGNAS